MARWTAWGVLCLMLSGVACQEADRGVQPGVILDRLSACENAYHETVGTLSTASAIRSETAAYAMDMHGMLDDLRQACRESMPTGSMMSGYNMADLTQVMDQMRTCVDNYTMRVKSMDVISDMMDVCTEHQAAMTEMFEEMQAMLRDARP